MAIRAYLYDANGTDQEVELNAEIVSNLNDSQVLWVDVSDFEEREIRQAAMLFDLQSETVANLIKPDSRPRLDNYGKYFQLNVNVLQVTDEKFRLADLSFVISSNLLITVHPLPIAFLESFDRRIKGDSELGQLAVPAFLAGLLDWHITSYFRLIEELEMQSDKLDSLALRPRDGKDLLSDLSKLRHRVAFVRRMLTPHREVYAAMVRPDFLHALSKVDYSTHYRLLDDRLERAIEAVENARELLVGAFDMFTTHTALRTNEVMKVLTLASVVLLPTSVIISLASLLLKSPVNVAHTPGFWLMLASIAVITITTLATARSRKWM